MPCTISSSDRSGREFIPNHEQGLSRESVVPGEVGTADTSKTLLRPERWEQYDSIPTGDLKWDTYENQNTARQNETRAR